MAAFATTASAMDLDGFGRCLRRERATFYGASWCPQCHAQRELLGEAMRHVRYVECALEGEPRKSTDECKVAHIDGYPTWTFADGTRVSGRVSLGYLAAKTGCELPRGAEAPTVPAPHAEPPHDSRLQPVEQVPVERLQPQVIDVR